MTHEEVITFIARGELRSYKQLPQIWYQIQTKFRDEPGPNRACCGSVNSYERRIFLRYRCGRTGRLVPETPRAYCRIFDRCGLEYVAVEADSGAMGGSQSQEFMIASDAGEDWSCDAKLWLRGQPGKSRFERAAGRTFRSGR